MGLEHVDSIFQRILFVMNSWKLFDLSDVLILKHNEYFTLTVMKIYTQKYV